MEKILINMDNHYINQGQEPFASVKFKDGSTIKQYGCGVCSISMLICEKLGLVTTTDKLEVVRAVISKLTNEKGLLFVGDMTFRDSKIRVLIIKDMLANLKVGKPAICQLPPHFVVVNGYDESKVGLARYIIKDPGAVARTNLQMTMSHYKTNIIKKRWDVTIL